MAKTLFDLAQEYLNQGMPDISQTPRVTPPGTLPPVTLPPQDPNAPTARILPMPGGGGGGGNNSNSIRSSNGYSPYNYRQSGEGIGTLANKQMEMYPDYYYGPTSKVGDVLNKAMNFIPGIGTVKRGLEYLGDKMPVNQRAIMENEMLGAGFALDDIGRIARGSGAYDTAANVMSGYNANQLTAESFDNRIEKALANMKDPTARVAALKAAKANWEKATGKATSVFDNKSLEKDPTYKSLAEQIAIENDINLGKEEDENNIFNANDKLNNNDFDGVKNFAGLNNNDFDGVNNLGAIDNNDFDGIQNFGGINNNDFDGVNNFGALDNNDFDGLNTITNTNLNDYNGFGPITGGTNLNDFDGPITGGTNLNDFQGITPITGGTNLNDYIGNTGPITGGTNQNDFVGLGPITGGTNNNDYTGNTGPITGGMNLNDYSGGGYDFSDFDDGDNSRADPGGTGNFSDAVTGNDTSPGATGGEGGNSSGGGKIVCTMMNESYGFGSFRNKIWLKHSKGLAPEYQKGYHKLFLPLVKLSKTNKVVRKILEHIAVHRTIDIRQESRGKVHLLGRLYRKILEPLCYLVGKHG